MDGVDVFPANVYEFVARTGTLPKTAAVAPSAYFDLFDKLTKQGKAVVHISLSSAISSSYQNACIAASDFDDVYVVDSKVFVPQWDLLCLKLAILRQRALMQGRLQAELIQ